MTADPFIGQIIMFGGSFAPRGWALCDGQLLAISQNTALFSILGTTYGGDGRTTFGLPDLRGRVPMHPGNGPGLTPRQLGQEGGSETNTLDITQLPNHAHAFPQIARSNVAGDTGDPTNAGLANTGARDRDYTSTTGGTANTGQTLPAGGSQPVNNLQPFNTVNFIIALQGLFPSRS